MLEIAKNFSGEALDVLLGVEIEDFFFETTPGFAKLKMETFFIVEVTVFDMKGKDSEDLYKRVKFAPEIPPRAGFSWLSSP